MLFKQYLETNLGIPSSQINMLCNEAATRTAVLRALKNLVTDKRIQRDDAIVIYFAGHGVEIDAPPSWECSDPARKIQCIAPYDFFDGPGRRVHAIPDRTINHLLASISEQHGQNIVSDYRSRVQKPLISGQTVIFDCCHSASGTRNQNTSTTDESLVARSINLELTGYPDDLDKDIFDHDISPVSEGEFKRAPRHLPEFKHNGLRSHVLLAACGIKEDAHEGSVILPHLENGAKRCGLFSAALLQLLYRVPHHQITYANILNQLNKIEGSVGQSITFLCRPNHFFAVDKTPNAKGCTRTDRFSAPRSFQSLYGGLSKFLTILVILYPRDITSLQPVKFTKSQTVLSSPFTTKTTLLSRGLSESYALRIYVRSKLLPSLRQLMEA